MPKSLGLNHPSERYLPPPVKHHLENRPDVLLKIFEDQGNSNFTQPIMDTLTVGLHELLVEKSDYLGISPEMDLLCAVRNMLQRWIRGDRPNTEDDGTLTKLFAIASDTNDGRKKFETAKILFDRAVRMAAGFIGGKGIRRVMSDNELFGFARGMAGRGVTLAREVHGEERRSDHEVIMRGFPAAVVLVHSVTPTAIATIRSNMLPHLAARFAMPFPNAGAISTAFDTDN